MNRHIRKSDASTLTMACSLACCGLAACLSGSPITATGGVGGGGGAGGSGGIPSSFDGETASGMSEPVTTTGGDTTTSSSGPVGPGKYWNFDKATESWHVSYGNPNPVLMNTHLTYDAGVGSPKAGAIRLVIPFSLTGQKVAVAVTPVSPLNLTARKITAQVKLDVGLAGGKAKVVAKLYVKSGDALVSADGGATTLMVNANWISIPLTVSTPEGVTSDGSYDPADIREIGIEISTEGDGVFAPVNLHIDTVGYD
jgi:hypothetical protein